MTARAVIEHALTVYYADSRDPQGIVAKLLDLYDAERCASLTVTVDTTVHDETVNELDTRSKTT